MKGFQGKNMPAGQVRSLIWIGVVVGLTLLVYGHFYVFTVRWTVRQAVVESGFAIVVHVAAAQVVLSLWRSSVWRPFVVGAALACAASLSIRLWQSWVEHPYSSWRYRWEFSLGCAGAFVLALPACVLARRRGAKWLAITIALLCAVPIILSLCRVLFATSWHYLAGLVSWAVAYGASCVGLAHVMAPSGIARVFAWVASGSALLAALLVVVIELPFVVWPGRWNWSALVAIAFMWAAASGIALLLWRVLQKYPFQATVGPVHCERCASPIYLRPGECVCGNCGHRLSVSITPRDCPSCGYDLANTTSRTCPECGTAF